MLNIVFAMYLKMEISNRPILPQDRTIKHHDSMYINPLISNAFKYAGFVEKFGTGIPKMINACKKYGNPEPDFTVYDKSISLILRPSGKYLTLVKNCMEKMSEKMFLFTILAV